MIYILEMIINEMLSNHQIKVKTHSGSNGIVEKKTKKYPRSGVWSSLHLLVTQFEIGFLQTLAFGGSVRLT